MLMKSNKKKSISLLYSEKDLVSFGNFLLSKERDKMISNDNVRNQVGHWDLANWKDKK